ncbi:NYN domain-containing protein [Actinocorallia sp. API 0066]|uniref:NYN domain-containing protein n=1 Tax=Actinocorallia sp. API 0066 TaxID=2896846 RepID=UPI001E5FE466|nr:NYN domain-containing protein [Actinocorallia sp. API 0066]MCD0448253.1 NYN domain-containing protein [Actinocorallia sp. API 0066]
MRTVLIVDAANVIGSRPDGWWRDRLGAARRLRDSLAGLGPLSFDAEKAADAEIVLVVEGAARSLEGIEGVRVVSAPRSGDDAIVAEVGPADTDIRYVVVTADRELRARCQARGADVVGPRFLLDRLG